MLSVICTHLGREVSHLVADTHDFPVIYLWMTLLFISPSQTGWNYRYYESEKSVRVIEVRPNVNYWGTLCGYLRVVEVFPAISVPRCKDESEYSASLISFLFRSSQVPRPHASGKGSLICYPLHVFWMAIVEPPNAQLFISAGGINFCSTFPLHASYRSPQLFSLFPG